MAKAFLYWALVAIALFVAGPIAGPLIGDLRGPDGASHVTPLTAAHPITGLARAGLAVLLALAVGLLGSWTFGSRVGMTLSGLVVAWSAFQSGAPDDIVRRTQSTSVLWRFALEGALFGVIGLVLAAALLRTGRRHQPAPTPPATRFAPESKPMLGMAAGLGAGLLAGGVLAWLLGFETLKMQTIFGASLAGIGVGAAAHLASSAVHEPGGSPARPAMLAFLTMAVLSVIGPVSAFAAPSTGVLRSAYDGTFFPLAAPLALDWLAGALLGVPIGLTWSGAILEKSHH